MDALDAALEEVYKEAKDAESRYGDFTSTHEALGVMLEEFDELTGAVRSNKLESVRLEALQVAAVAIRLAVSCRDNEAFSKRSTK